MTTVSAAYRSGSARSFRRQKRLFLLSVLVPMAVIFLVFWIYPLLNGLWGSFTRWQAFVTDREFIGLQNYQSLIADPVFIRSVANTLIYAAIYVPGSIILALSLALAIEGSGRPKTLFRFVYFLPVVTSVIATGLIWAFLYQPSVGLFNQVLGLVGLPTQRFLLSPDQALVSVIVYSLWKSLGFQMVLFMAGLNNIDRSFLEAARVDGAGRWSAFRHVTLPLLRPTMIFVSLTGIIEALQVFGPIFVMTSREANAAPGGPLNSTMVTSVYQWQVAFRELNLGYASAMGIALFGIMLVITLLQAPLLRSRWDY